MIIAAEKRVLNKKDNEGYTPLHLAVIANNKPLLEAMFNMGADPTVVDQEGHNCIHWATGMYGQCGDRDHLFQAG